MTDRPAASTKPAEAAPGSLLGGRVSLEGPARQRCRGIVIEGSRGAPAWPRFREPSGPSSWVCSGGVLRSWRRLATRAGSRSWFPLWP